MTLLFHWRWVGFIFIFIIFFFIFIVVDAWVLSEVLIHCYRNYCIRLRGYQGP